MTDEGNNGSENRSCPWCGQEHAGVCPRVRQIEYYPDGAVRRVTFRRAARRVAAPPARIGQVDLGEWEGISEHSLDFVLALGEGGPMIRQDLINQVEVWWGIGPGPGAGHTKRSLRRLLEAGLIAGERVENVDGAGPGYLREMRLSSQGEEIYRLLTGKAPAQGAGGQASRGAGKEPAEGAGGQRLVRVGAGAPAAESNKACGSGGDELRGDPVRAEPQALVQPGPAGAAPTRTKGDAAWSGQVSTRSMAAAGQAGDGWATTRG